MATLAEELTALKTEEDKITGNKVANFSYDDYAYEHNDANGVDTYNVDNHQNIPNGTANILKVNATILTKGWRAQASAITRMLMNHFLGRCSYNLNKINDHFSALLTKLLSYLGVANGIATLDANGYVPTGQLSPTGVVKTVNSHAPSNGNVDVSKSDVGLNNVVNTGDSATPSSGGTSKFTTGGAYTMRSQINTALSGKAPNNHASSDTTYGHATDTMYGHVKVNGGRIRQVYSVSSSTSFPSAQDVSLLIVNNTSSGSVSSEIRSLFPRSAIKITVTSSGISRSTINTAGSVNFRFDVSFPADSTTFILFDSLDGFLSN